MQLRLFDAFSKTKGNFLLASELCACFVRATLNTVRSFSTTLLHYYPCLDPPSVH